jgi:hypothetical protein
LSAPTPLFGSRFGCTESRCRNRERAFVRVYRLKIDRLWAAHMIHFCTEVVNHASFRSEAEDGNRVSAKQRRALPFSAETVISGFYGAEEVRSHTVIVANPVAVHAVSGGEVSHQTAFLNNVDQRMIRIGCSQWMLLVVEMYLEFRIARPAGGFFRRPDLLGLSTGETLKQNDK